MEKNIFQKINARIIFGKIFLQRAIFKKFLTTYTPRG